MAVGVEMRGVRVTGTVVGGRWSGIRVSGRCWWVGCDEEVGWWVDVEGKRTLADGGTGIRRVGKWHMKVATRKKPAESWRNGCATTPMRAVSVLPNVV